MGYEFPKSSVIRLGAAFALLVVVQTCHPCLTLAEDKVVTDDEQKEEQIRDEKIAFLQAKIGEGVLDYVVGHMRLRVEEMRRELDLSESDTKKLNLVAKGTASRFTDGFEARVKSMATTTLAKIDSVFSVNGQRYVLPHTEPDDDEQPQAKVLFKLTETMCSIRIRSNKGSSGYGFGGGIGAIYQQDLWKNAVKEILTPEELERFETSEYDRLVKALANTVRARMDVSLRLTAEQQKKLDAWLADHIRQKFTKTTLNRDTLTRVPLKTFNFKDEGFTSILTELQREYWADLIAYDTLY